MVAPKLYQALAEWGVRGGHHLRASLQLSRGMDFGQTLDCRDVHLRANPSRVGDLQHDVGCGGQIVKCRRRWRLTLDLRFEPTARVIANVGKFPWAGAKPKAIGGDVCLERGHGYVSVAGASAYRPAYTMMIAPVTSQNPMIFKWSNAARVDDPAPNGLQLRDRSGDQSDKWFYRIRRARGGQNTAPRCASPQCNTVRGPCRGVGTPTVHRQWLAVTSREGGRIVRKPC